MRACLGRTDPRYSPAQGNRQGLAQRRPAAGKLRQSRRQASPVPASGCPAEAIDRRFSGGAAGSVRRGDVWSLRFARPASGSFPPSLGAAGRVARPIAVRPAPLQRLSPHSQGLTQAVASGRPSCAQTIGHRTTKLPHRPSATFNELGLWMLDRTREWLLSRQTTEQSRSCALHFRLLPDAIRRDPTVSALIG